MVESRKKTFCSIFGFFLLVMWIKLGVIEDKTVSSYTEDISDNLKVSSSSENISYYFNQTLIGNGVILHLKGGIGNQLFEYACSYALARDRNWPLYNFVWTDNLNKMLSEGRTFQPFHRDYALDKFQIPVNHFIDKSTAIHPYSITFLNDSQLLFGTYANNSFLQLSGQAYCQSISYWARYKDEILSMFQLKPEVIQKFPPYVKLLGKQIEETENSVAVHVRRGDFVRIKGFDVPISYQRSAIRRIIKILKERQTNSSLTGPASPPKFFVFSDDIDYAKRKLGDFANHHDFRFISQIPGTKNRTTSIQDFYLIAKCKHFIIPNSTFGWWAAYLSTEKGAGNRLSERIVIASAFNPMWWEMFKDKQNFYKMLYGKLYHPRSWIVINTFVGEH